MKETFYFSHDYNARSDVKIKRLIAKHGLLGYGIYWAIIEDLYQNANALPLDCESIAFDLRTHEDIIKSIINDFDLFVIEDKEFGSLSVQRRLDERAERSTKAKESANKRWGKNANALRTHSEGNAIKERKGKERKEKEIESKFNFKSNLVSLGLDEQIADDYLKVRKAKKGVNSKTAFDMLISEVKKSNKPISECIKLCIERNWITYKAEWDKNSTQNNKQLFRCKMSNPANGHFVVDLTEEEIEKRTATGYTKLMTKTPL